jgi:uncharacterized protein with beta-barrel porin domain
LPTNTKLEKTIAGLQGAASDLKTYSQDTNDQQAKQLFTQLSGQIEGCVSQLKARLHYVQQEEPQYRQQQ